MHKSSKQFVQYSNFGKAKSPLAPILYASSVKRNLKQDGISR